ncbi:fungal-specific transcription factor domain-containing protein [Podospora didyma]|uniref:Fungal-specific transcription factor domain-containing protein n=1 Tax=Podospora didyma TaxID=330526 RepID=A0AAE0K0P3_9PEZI|nr:fungal-specific transcription factor domain-containing protein [Podospora didyma]
MPSTTTKASAAVAAAADNSNGTNSNTNANGTPAPAKRPRQSSGPACQQCRLRKLRCDRQMPCGACVDTGVACHVDPTTPQRGPKRGHLKVLRSRIAALERHIGKSDPGGVDGLDLDNISSSGGHESDSPRGVSPVAFSGVTAVSIPATAALDLSLPDAVPPTSLQQHLVHLEHHRPSIGGVVVPQVAPPPPATLQTINPAQLPLIDDGGIRGSGGASYHHHQIDHQALGWPATTTTGEDAQLIPSLTRADLDQLYFDRVHVFMPVLQQCRYYNRSSKPSSPTSSHRNSFSSTHYASSTSFSTASHECLQYAMWAMAASLSSQFQHLRCMLYREVLERLKALELASHSLSAEDEATSRLEQAQAWILVAIYELMQVGFHRAWASAGRAIRLVQLLRLNEVDYYSSHADGSEDAPDVFVEKEVKRRTFWMALCLDRFSCVLGGLPLTLSEQGISTRLPCPEDAFQSGTPMVMPFLPEVMVLDNQCKLSPFAECVVFTMLWGQVLVHKQQAAAATEYAYSGSSNTTNSHPTPADFCKRQLWLDSILSRRMLHLQQNYRAASIRVDSMLLLTSMVAQSALLLLCKAVESVPPTAAEYGELIDRFAGREAAGVKEIARLSKFLTHFSIFKVHPFTPISLFLCQQSILSLRDRDASLEDDLGTITDALRELKAVNGLCQEGLDMSSCGFSDFDPPGLLGTPDSLMAFLDSEMTI